MMMIAPAAGLWRMARLPGFTQGVVSLNVGSRFGGEPQGARSLHGWWVDRFAVDQPVKHVQDMRLGRRASLQRQFDSGKDGLFVVLEHQGEDLDHLAVAAWRLEHTLL